MRSDDQSTNIKAKFGSFFESRTEEQQLRHMEYMLMASFLSEIERIQKQKGIKRNKLAALINTSPSYLTQVFKGDKPLNFHTLAKIQQVLHVRFEVKGRLQKKAHSNHDASFNTPDGKAVPTNKLESVHHKR